MKGTKYLSELIENPEVFLPGKINIIDADTSGGKTYFALNTLPQWAGSPEKVLYLIDTSNAEKRLRLKNLLTIGRKAYALGDYGSPEQWGEFQEATKGKMPVMTYAGFGVELQKSPNLSKQFSYIVCDEIHNLIKYQNFGRTGNNGNLLRAENALRDIVNSEGTIIVAITATPKSVREKFGELSHNVPYDREALFRYETRKTIHYSGIQNILRNFSLGRTGILYTHKIQDMKNNIDFARGNGISAEGFWSENNKDHTMTDKQLLLRNMILKEEAFPEDLQLLVINASSETSIKIQSDKRRVDYMIIHTTNEETRTQVRGRYCGDLETLYLHGKPTDDIPLSVPLEFMDTNLFAEEKDALCKTLNLRDEKGRLLKWTTVKKRLREAGYTVKENRENNRHYSILSRELSGQKLEVLYGVP